MRTSNSVSVRPFWSAQLAGAVCCCRNVGAGSEAGVRGREGRTMGSGVVGAMRNACRIAAKVSIGQYGDGQKT